MTTVNKVAPIQPIYTVNERLDQQRQESKKKQDKDNKGKSFKEILAITTASIVLVVIFSVTVVHSFDKSPLTVKVQQSEQVGGIK